MSRFTSIGGAVLALAVLASTSFADTVTIVPSISNAVVGTTTVNPLTDLVGNTLYVYTSGGAATYNINLGVLASLTSGEEFGNVQFGINTTSALTLGSTYTPNNSSGAWLNVNTGSTNTLNGSFGNTPGSLNQIVASVGAGQQQIPTQVPYAANSPQALVGTGSTPTPVGSISVAWDGVTAGQVLKIQDSNGIAKQLQFSAESTTTGAILSPQTSASLMTVQFVPGIAGDADYSGVVNGGDLGILGQHFGAGPNAVGGPSIGDFDRSGTVNGGDLGILGQNFGASWTDASHLPAPLVQISDADLPEFASPSAVPEPASLGLLALGGIALLNRRRKA